VISTGIGTDNIDIVLNELDALVNIDFETRTVKDDPVSLDIIRIGTSGAIQPDIPMDSFLLSEYAIGFDNLAHFYNSEHIQHPDFQMAIMDHTNWAVFKSVPYVVQANASLSAGFKSHAVRRGITATNSGFYGPQGRSLRLATSDNSFLEKLASFEFNGMRITNLEMETSGIYALALLLGHRAISMNCIIANRATGEYSLQPEKAMEDMIGLVLNNLSAG
jgi:uridine phosphorylase